MELWLIWDHHYKSYHWIMYEQDGHLAVFSSKEKAEEHVKTHPRCFQGEVSYETTYLDDV